MSDSITLDHSSVDGLSQVAAAIRKLDEFFGLLASVPGASPTLLAVNAWGPDATWYSAWISGQAWYGSSLVASHGQSWRNSAFDGLFAMFEPDDMQNKFLRPLAQLSQIESDIRAANGAATLPQKNTVTVVLTSISQWLGQKNAAAQASFDALTHFVKGVRDLSDLMARDVAIFSQSPAVVALNHRVVDLAAQLDAPDDSIILAFASLQNLVAGISQRLTVAAEKDLGSVLQRLNINASLNEWPILCRMAQSYRPGSMPPIPPPPAGF